LRDFQRQCSTDRGATANGECTLLPATQVCRHVFRDRLFTEGFTTDPFAAPARWAVIDGGDVDAPSDWQWNGADGWRPRVQVAFAGTSLTLTTLGRAA
jgi:hypothetical protein